MGIGGVDINFSLEPSVPLGIPISTPTLVQEGNFASPSSPASPALLNRLIGALDANDQATASACYQEILKDRAAIQGELEQFLWTNCLRLESYLEISVQENREEDFNRLYTFLKDVDAVGILKKWAKLPNTSYVRKEFSETMRSSLYCYNPFEDSEEWIKDQLGGSSCAYKTTATGTYLLIQVDQKYFKLRIGEFPSKSPQPQLSLIEEPMRMALRRMHNGLEPFRLQVTVKGTDGSTQVSAELISSLEDIAFSITAACQDKRLDAYASELDFFSYKLPIALQKCKVPTHEINALFARCDCTLLFSEPHPILNTKCFWGHNWPTIRGLIDHLDYTTLSNEQVYRAFDYALQMNVSSAMRKLCAAFPGIISEMNRSQSRDVFAEACICGYTEMAETLAALGFSTQKALTFDFGPNYKIQSPIHALLVLIKVVRRISRKDDIDAEEKVKILKCASLISGKDRDPGPLKEFKKQNSSIINVSSNSQAEVQTILNISLDVLAKVFLNGNCPHKEALCDFAVTYQQFYLLWQYAKEHPEVIVEWNADKTRDYLGEMIEAGYVDDALELLALGADPNKNVPVKRPDNFVTTVEAPLSRLVLLLEQCDSKGIVLDQIQQQRILLLASELIKKGANPLQMMCTPHQAEISYSVMEALILNYGPNHQLCRTIAVQLLDKGATITPRVAEVMRGDVISSKETLFLPYLKAQGWITEDEVRLFVQSKPEVGSPEEVSIRLYQAEHVLRTQMQLFNLNPDLVSIEEIDSFRRLKKDAKGVVKANPENENLRRQFETVVRLYDEYIDRHVFLSELRKISQDIRKESQKAVAEQKADIRLTRFFSIWSNGQSYDLSRATQRVGILFTQQRKDVWEKLRASSIKGYAAAAKSDFLKYHTITFLHGTKSSSLPILLRIKALMPMGLMLQQGDVPFCGEVCGSDKGINNDGVSGEFLTLTWDEKVDHYLNAASRVIVNYLYATKADGYHEHEKIYNPSKSLERTTPAYLSKMMDPKNMDANWTLVRVDILRLRHTDPNADKHLAPLKEAVEEALKKGSYYHEEELKDLLHALTVKMEYILAPEELKEIASQGYPIIFASTTVDTESPRDLNGRECLAKGKLEFGKDLQIAFTSAEKVDVLQKKLGPLGIEVLPFEAALYFETLNMIKGTQNCSMKKEVAAKQIGFFLQRDILPCYATPFPSLPSYYDEKEGRRKQVPDPMFDHRGSTYAQYIERVNKGEILARDVHDPMHAVHVVMWALAGLQLHIKHGIPCPGINTLFLALAAGSHDRARRADGVDFWDGESAQAFKSLMRALGYDVKEIEAYVHAIREKDPKGKIFTSKIQELIHDADCWDIIRCLKDFSEFDKNELCVYRNGQIPKEVLDQMTEEIRTFIKITSDFSLRQRLQSTSTNYFRDVLLILAAHKKECPLLNELLDYEIRMS